MKITFDNAERTRITLTTGMWWWKRQAKVRKYSFQERYDRKTYMTDPYIYRFIANNEPVPQDIVTDIIVAEYRAEKPEREAERKRLYNEVWKKP